MGNSEDTFENHTVASFTGVGIPVLKNQLAKRIDDPLIRTHEDGGSWMRRSVGISEESRKIVKQHKK